MDVVVQISARREWHSSLSPSGSDAECYPTPMGSWVPCEVGPESALTAVAHYSGTGKVNAASATQYAIMTWRPRLLVLLGTCGSMQPSLTPPDLILVTRTLVYDITCPSSKVNQAKMAELTTDLHPSWSFEGSPYPVHRGPVATGDGDPTPDQGAQLRDRHQVLAVDWETGAVAKVCEWNQVPCLVLRGVSDMVAADASTQLGDYRTNTPRVMARLWETLRWLAAGDRLV